MLQESVQVLCAEGTKGKAIVRLLALVRSPHSTWMDSYSMTSSGEGGERLWEKRTEKTLKQNQKHQKRTQGTEKRIESKPTQKSKITHPKPKVNTNQTHNV